MSLRAYRVGPAASKANDWRSRGWMVPVFGIPVLALVAVLGWRVRASGANVTTATASSHYDTGVLEVDTYGPATCEVNGVQHGATPFRLRLPVGVVTVACAKEIGDVPYQKTTTAIVAPNVTVTLRLALEAPRAPAADAGPPRPVPPWGW